MTQAAKPTLRLVSRHWTNLLLALDLHMPTAAMSLRRRKHTHMLSVPRGGVVDLCAQLNVETPEQAREIIERSPEATKHIREQRLVLVAWPPPEPKPAPATDEITEALMPAPSSAFDVSELLTAPDMDWSRSRLRTHAIERGIMVGKRWSKQQILDAIMELGDED